MRVKYRIRKKYFDDSGLCVIHTQTAAARFWSQSRTGAWCMPGRSWRRRPAVSSAPGHTAGGLSVLWREKKLLFVGDAANFFVWLFTRESTGRQSYLNMLDKIDALPVDAYLGGHSPRPMTHEDLALFRRAALEADYSRGEPFSTFLDQDRHPRICPLAGYGPEDMFLPGYAAVVIAEDF